MYCGVGFCKSAPRPRMKGQPLAPPQPRPHEVPPGGTRSVASAFCVIKHKRPRRSVALQRATAIAVAPTVVLIAPPSFASTTEVASHRRDWGGM